MWKPESRVAVVLPEGPQQADAILAVSVRCCCIPLDAGLPEAVLQEALRRTGAEAVLAGIDRRLSLPVLDLADLPAVGEEPPVRFCLTTSGTTGEPKVVSLTSEMVHRSCQNIAEALQLSPQDRMGRGAALHHVYGLMHYLAGHYAGGSAVCPAASSASEQWRAFVDGDVTWIAAVPSWHRSLLEAARRHGGRPPRLRLLRSSTAPLSSTLAAEMERVMEAPVVEGYGMTETTSQVASQPLDPAQRKWGSVGRVWGVTVTVVDEGGAALAPGQLGRIVVEGPTTSNLAATGCGGSFPKGNGPAGNWPRAGLTGMGLTRLGLTGLGRMGGCCNSFTNCFVKPWVRPTCTRASSPRVGTRLRELRW